MKITYQITGLDCANCAAMLARLMRKVPGVDGAEIDFLGGKAMIECAEMTDRIYEKLRELAAGFDGATLSPLGEEKAAIFDENQDRASCGRENCTDQCSLGENSSQTHSVEGRRSFHGHSHAHDRKKEGVRMELFQIGASAALLLLGALLPVGFYPSLALYLAAYFAVGAGVLWSAAKNLCRGRIFDENFLMSLATVGAFFLGEYAEGVFVMLFYAVGELFQGLATAKSRRSITQALELKVATCRVLEGETVRELPPEEVTPGQIIAVRPGERIALDGVVVRGASGLDTSALTGESKVTEVLEGSAVLGGSVNFTGALEIRVTKSYADGTVGKILELVENSSMNKAKTEKFITRFAGWYTPLVVGAALLVGVGIPLVFGNFLLWLRRALVFLVVSCPCALVLSVPLTFFAGIGCMAKRGVLVKGGNFVEVLAKADLLLTDKTGTLTDGKLKIARIRTEVVSEEELLRLAALLESGSNHPVARALTEGYGKPLSRAELEFMEEVAGYGVAGEIGGDRVLCGSKRMMERFGVPLPVWAKEEENTAVFLARSGKFLGGIFFTDSVKSEAAATVEELRSLGVTRACMLTGDSPAFSEEVSAAVGLDACYAGLLPDGKVQVLTEERRNQSKKGCIYLGDGINDAPVLAAADAGVAMGALGSDVAVETADIVVMDDDLKKLAAARRAAKKTVRIVWQNVAFSLGVKLAVMALSVAGYSSMWMAVFADVGVMVLAVLNALRAGFDKKYGRKGVVSKK